MTFFSRICKVPYVELSLLCGKPEFNSLAAIAVFAISVFLIWWLLSFLTSGMRQATPATRAQRIDAAKATVQDAAQDLKARAVQRSQAAQAAESAYNVVGVVDLPDQYNYTLTNQQGGSDAETLILFHAPWCGHCKQLRPTWDNLVSQVDNRLVNGKLVKVKEVNADEEPELVKQYGVNGFPTVVLESKDGAKVYEGDRSLESLKSFLAQ